MRNFAEALLCSTSIGPVFLKEGDDFSNVRQSETEILHDRHVFIGVRVVYFCLTFSVVLSYYVSLRSEFGIVMSVTIST
jgi:hypothetical protein